MWGGVPANRKGSSDMIKVTRRNVLLTGVTAAALAAVSIPAYALHSKDIAYTPGKAVTVSETFWVDSHQDVTVTLSLSPDGAIRLQGRFSNGKKWDGDHFFARAILLDGLGAAIVTGQVGAGLNGSGMGGTNVAWAEKSYKLDPAYPQAVRAIRLQAGTRDEEDDAAFWQKVTQAVGVAGGVAIGIATGGFAIFPIDGGVQILGPVTF